MVTLPTYHICLICTAIESPPQGGLPAQGTEKAYVILLHEATYVSQNEHFALCLFYFYFVCLRSAGESARTTAVGGTASLMRSSGGGEAWATATNEATVITGRPRGTSPSADKAARTRGMDVVADDAAAGRGSTVRCLG